MQSTSPPPPEPEWKLVFRQSLGDYDWPSWRKNAEDPGADNYAILDELERFRGADGKFEFKMEWAGVDDGPQIWKQSSNPTTSEHPVDGYEAVDDACGSSKRWGGLALGNPTFAKIDGNKGSWWWYAVMAGRTYKGGLPACTKPATRTELYVWNENPAPVVQHSTTAVATTARPPLLGHAHGAHSLEAPREMQAEPCCGANPSNSSADAGHCRERGVDLFARHQGFIELFGDNVAMNPTSYKFFLERDCKQFHGKVRCKYIEVTDPDVYSHEFPVGKSNVKIKALDISGNPYECTKTVYVYDDEPPVFTTPPDERAPALTHNVNDATCSITNTDPIDAYEGLGFS
jgi:hypothetical protein